MRRNSKRILLTGGSGSVGKAVVDRLNKAGYAVRVIGRRTGLIIEGAEYQACDVNDYATLKEAACDCQVIVHLAAIPNPGLSTPEEIFRVNCSGSFNVFQAAAELGIRKVVQASSINATGQFFGLKPAPLHYLPIDEVHPVFSTDAYSFSKNIVEETARFFWNREGISSVSLRLPWVAPHAIHEQIGLWRQEFQHLCAKLSSLPMDKRRRWFHETWQRYNDFRASRPYEPPKASLTWNEDEHPAGQRDFLVMSQRVNFFTMLDELDSAQAIEKSVSTSFEGAHALFINDHLTWTGVPTRTLIDLFYPDVPNIHFDYTGCETLVSIDAARKLIGFEPQFTYGE